MPGNVRRGETVFAQVACGTCGKPFQVPPTKVGEAIPCPWCREIVTALPLTGVVAEELPEDAPPSAPVARMPVASPTTIRATWVKPLVLTLFSMLALVVAFFASRYYRGAVPGFLWDRFEAPEGHCRIELPGTVTEGELPAIPALRAATGGGKQFASRSILTRLRGFVGWYDLDPERVKLARSEDMLSAVREWRKTDFGWTVEAESVKGKMGGFDVLEVRYTADSGRHTERYVLVSSPARPRLYLVGVGGGGFDPEGETAKRVLTSFWFDETK